MIILYVTCKDAEEAKKIGETLVKDKLIACANYFPIKSIYEWKGNTQNDDEFVLLLKTTEEKQKQTENKIIQLHSYELPCILKIQAEANEEYSNWVKEQVN